MTRVTLLKGLPASGKSTAAKAMVTRSQDGTRTQIKRVNKDTLRSMLDNRIWHKDDEKFVLTVRDLIISAAVKAGYDVVVDDTNLAPKHEARIKQLVGKNAEVVVDDSFLAVSLEECIERDLKRENSVGADVIKGMHHQFLQRGESTPAVPAPDHVPDAPRAIVVDLDGTIALIGDRSPYDGENCQVDTVNKPVALILQMWRLHNLPEGNVVIFCSGRAEKGREASAKWLKDNLGIDVTDGQHPLYMRPNDDYRKDAIVKREMYDNHMLGKFNVDFVLDDRTAVVEMWRSLGLSCLQVAPGDF